MPNYELSAKIEDGSRLAEVFNTVLRKLDLERIVSSPRTFQDLDNESAPDAMLMFYTSILYEKWMHGVIARLRRWEREIGTYLNDYQGSWRYYACSNRIDMINEYGGADSDYDKDGNLIKENITDDQLIPYTIVRELSTEGYDIVKDTTPKDLAGLATALELHARTTPQQILGLMGLPQAQPYKAEKDPDGNIVLTPMTEEDIELKKISDSVNGEEMFQTILFTCKNITHIHNTINNLTPTENNTEILKIILQDTQNLLGCEDM